MKKLGLTINLILIAAVLAFGQDNQDKKEETNKAKITFEKKVHDFGEIPYKGNGVYEFKFKNSGKAPLVLTNVKTSCGCTTPSWPREPIEKDKTGKIKVKYNTKLKGKFSKSVTVYSNAENSREVLKIKGEVK